MIKIQIPTLEEIYDYDIDTLISSKQDIDKEIDKINKSGNLTKNVSNLVPYEEEQYNNEKYLRKLNKIKNFIDSELAERQNVDNMINFFLKEDAWI